MARLLAQYFPRVWRVARRMGLDPAEAEEAAQEAFMVLVQKWSRIEVGKELAFLFSAVAHITRNLRRKSSHRRECPYAPDALERVASETTAADWVERGRARDLVDQILACLSEPQRVVFVLYEFEQMTLQETADLLGIPIGTAGSRLRLARRMFRKQLRRLDRHRPSSQEPP